MLETNLVSDAPIVYTTQYKNNLRKITHPQGVQLKAAECLLDDRKYDPAARSEPGRFLGISAERTRCLTQVLTPPVPTRRQPRAV